MQNQLPIVAIVGRPNVGKSSIFNRITADARPSSALRKQVAVVNDRPGVTRDRNYADVKWGKTPFTIVDTGGMDVDPDDPLIDNVQLQVDHALAEATLVLFVVDVRTGIMPHDTIVADKLRSSGKPILLVANKADSVSLEMDTAEFYRLGLEAPVLTSCVQNTGIQQLLDQVVEVLPEVDNTSEDSTKPIKISIVGRPNVGKSSILNSLLGEERMIVDNRPGTTRDAVNIRFVYQNIPFELVDTAGMRRKSSIKDELESETVQRAIHSIRQSDIAALILDVTQELAQQDKTIANFIARNGKASVLVLNKWDLVEKDNATHGKFMSQIEAQVPQLDYVPKIFVSALTGQRVSKILDVALEVYREYCTRIPTPALNELLLELRTSHPPPRVKGTRPALKYITQVETQPPTFLIFGRNTHRVRPPYTSYLINNIRSAFGFHGTPIRIFYRRN
ncbi:MAG: ribosome biogenesis GTPase Der [Candidatus Poribacteria bacterium]|nr:ribosome biogenesis GTPase Der [Candidatus Poribacteria bacterium]